MRLWILVIGILCIQVVAAHTAINPIHECCEEILNDAQDADFEEHCGQYQMTKEKCMNPIVKAEQETSNTTKAIVLGLCILVTAFLVRYLFKFRKEKSHRRV